MMLRDTCSDLDSSKVFWRVILPSGEQVMTLDELDQAFDAGRVDAATLVCAPDSFEFVRLGAVAGLDAEADNAASIDVEFDERAQQARSLESDLGARASASRFDVQTRVDAPSAAPWIVDTSPEENAPTFRPRFPYRRLLAVPAVLGLIAVLACAAHASTSSEPAAAVAHTERAPASSPPPAVEPAPAVVTAPPAPAPSLSEPQKKALAAKDKKAEAARNAKRAAAATKRTPAKKSSSPFVKGGSKHDPMNASL